VNYLVTHGVDRLVEVGSGKVLTGLAKRISKETAAMSVATPDDIAAFKAQKN
jgi:[acyl-carrier-protein] S-malonyltransferase